ncbi:FtsX-like permease family protein [bacterium]|nr:MAG: FtsX-like permease family protein [bacterium]
MIKNYFIVAFRNLYRKNLYTFINLFGLSVSLGACIVGYLTWDFGYHFDQFHQKVNQIYHVGSTRAINGQDQLFGISPLPLGPALVRDFPGVTRAVRFASQVSVVKFEDKVFNERVNYADDGFFDMFTFEFLQGDKSALKDRNSIIITRDVAIKYFGDEHAMGKRLTLSHDNDRKRDHVVGAILKQVPRNSSLDFDILISGEVLVDLGIDEPNNWAHVTGSTFIEVTDDNVAGAIEAAENKYVDLVKSANPRFAISHLVMTPLKDLALISENFRSHDLRDAPPPSARISIFVISIMLLIMACFNYMNTSLAIAAGRLKEIGIRKVMGSPRTQLIIQFLMENILLCLLALGVAFGIAELLVPGWNSLFPDIRLSMDEAWNFKLGIFLAGLLTLTALGGGFYPAYVISAYNPAQILRGNQSKMTTSRLMKVMLTVQFALSMIAVVGSLVFSQNAEFQKNLDQGYNEDKIIGVPLQKSSMYPLLSNTLRQNPLIENVSAGRNHIFFSSWRRVIQGLGRDIEADFLYVSPGYAETVGFKLVQGRFLSESTPLDFSESVVINRMMATEQGWDDPIGRTLTIDSVTCRVVGVVDDFYNRGTFRPILPTVIKMAKENTYSFAIVRVDSKNLKAAMTSIESDWKRLFPEMPFEGFYQEEATIRASTISDGIKLVFLYVACMAIVISGMGLFALVSLNIVRRTKEIGIRKVLGASVSQIVGMMNSDFVFLLIIASVIADVAGYFAVKALLDSIYKYHVNVEVTALILANVVVLGIGLVTIGGRVLRVAQANPVDSLRYE